MQSSKSSPDPFPDTGVNGRPSSSTKVSVGAVAVLTLLSLLIRGMALSWQPLWWDEGYSVYFATEPLQRMIELTALDIHPPLYYGLLHGWLRLFDSTGPVALRSFSVMTALIAIPAMAWLARSTFPGRRRIIIVATLLLAVNPMHLYYSQEVRMYGLAMLLGMVTTTLFWVMLRDTRALTVAGYIVAATLSLYTLYYLAFLILAHALWGIWSRRHHGRQLRKIVATFGGIALLTLPWLLFALPKLLNYVDAKIASDKDIPLTPGAYLWRHSLAMTGGHVATSDPVARIGLACSIAALLLLAGTCLFLTMRKYTEGARASADRRADDGVYGALWTIMLVPLIAAFLLNLRLPFFPDGGERVLLFLLPYVLLLLAAAIDTTWSTHHTGKVGLALLLISAVTGIGIYFSTPRYTTRDYRPVIAQIVQQGQEGDTVFAIFPWQVGYWRAYTDGLSDAMAQGPTPLLASDSAVTWDASMAAMLGDALDRGTVWFPAPLSFGSTLPAEIEAALATQAVNVENRWYGPATRLSAWRRLQRPTMVPINADFGPLALTNAGVSSSESVSSANEIVAVALDWQERPSAAEALHATVRLRDDEGRVWAQRDYAPIGSLGSDSSAGIQETVGLIVPVGLPPARYHVSVGVGLEGAESLLHPARTDALTDPLIDIGELVVVAPDATQPLSRLPIQTALAPIESRDNLRFLGYAGLNADDALLAGTDLDLTLFLQNQQVAPPQRHLYVSLLDRERGVAGWEGWPLDSFPTQSWSEGALVQVPLQVALPATLAAGKYHVVVGTVDPSNGEKSDPVDLGTVTIESRPAQFSEPTMQHRLDQAVQFGTHALLLGYDLKTEENTLYVTLHWQVLQTLLPAHHLFIHVNDSQGRTVAQYDGPPATAGGPAPTGSWLPDEFISTLHAIPIPDALDPVAVQLGIYNPDGNIRLPTTVADQPAGDALTISLDRE